MNSYYLHILWHRIRSRLEEGGNKTESQGGRRKRRKTHSKRSDFRVFQRIHSVICFCVRILPENRNILLEKNGGAWLPYLIPWRVLLSMYSFTWYTTTSLIPKKKQGSKKCSENLLVGNILYRRSPQLSTAGLRISGPPSRGTATRRCCFPFYGWILPKLKILVQHCWISWISKHFTGPRCL